MPIIGGCWNICVIAGTFDGCVTLRGHGEVKEMYKDSADVGQS